MTDYTRNKNVIHEQGTCNTKVHDSINQAKKHSRKLQSEGHRVSVIK